MHQKTTSRLQLYRRPSVRGLRHAAALAGLLAGSSACGTGMIEAAPISDQAAPIISEVTVASVTATTARITWSTDELADGSVEYGTGSDYGGSTPRHASTLAHETVLTGLAAATRYHFRVKSRDAAGNLATSDGSTFTTAPESTDSLPPSVAITSPAADTTYTTPQTVTLVATAVDDLAVARVEFYQAGSLQMTDSESPYEYRWSISAADNGDHSFTARAYDAAGNQATSSARVLTVDIAGPSAVLVWDANSESDLQGYFVYQRTAGGSYGVPVATVSEPTCTLTGLASGTTYHFVVTAYDSSGNESLPSNEVSKSIP